MPVRESKGEGGPHLLREVLKEALPRPPRPPATSSALSPAPPSSLSAPPLPLPVPTIRAETLLHRSNNTKRKQDASQPERKSMCILTNETCGPYAPRETRQTIGTKTKH